MKAFRLISALTLLVWVSTTSFVSAQQQVPCGDADQYIQGFKDKFEESLLGSGIVTFGGNGNFHILLNPTTGTWTFLIRPPKRQRLICMLDSHNQFTVAPDGIHFHLRVEGAFLHFSVDKTDKWSLTLEVIHQEDPNEGPRAEIRVILSGTDWVPAEDDEIKKKPTAYRHG